MKILMLVTFHINVFIIDDTINNISFMDDGDNSQIFKKVK